MVRFEIKGDVQTNIRLQIDPNKNSRWTSSNGCKDPNYTSSVLNPEHILLKTSSSIISKIVGGLPPTAGLP